MVRLCVEDHKDRASVSTWTIGVTNAFTIQLVIAACRKIPVCIAANRPKWTRTCWASVYRRQVKVYYCNGACEIALPILPFGVHHQLPLAVSIACERDIEKNRKGRTYCFDSTTTTTNTEEKYSNFFSLRPFDGQCKYNSRNFIWECSFDKNKHTHTPHMRTQIKNCKRLRMYTLLFIWILFNEEENSLLFHSNPENWNVITYFVNRAKNEWNP